ncbi:MAG: restriction endonuclease subunit S [Hormoscilla sp. GM102CHS1]|nr:restriction endonuclease subunit S [Hormoscilla sp. GM102CHS1]
MSKHKLASDKSEVPEGYKKTEVGVIPEDWEVVAFSELFEFRNGVNADKEAYKRGLPFINVLEIITHTHLYPSHIPGRVSLPKSLIESYVVRHGDILFNRTSETQEEVGLASVYLGDETVVFGGFVIRGRNRSYLFDPIYSRNAFRASSIRFQIIARGQGAVRANIGQEELSKILAIIPPIEEQRAIAQTLSDVDGLIAALDRAIAKKRNIKTATMQELLIGKKRLPGFHGEWEMKLLGEMGVTYGGLNGKTKADFGTGSSQYIPFLNIINNVVVDPDDIKTVKVSISENQNQVKMGDLFLTARQRLLKRLECVQCY